MFPDTKTFLLVLLSFTEFIGRFHPVIVHLPIGVLLLALFMQWLSRKEQYSLSHGLMKVIWLIGFFSALLSCITGYLLSLNGEYEDDTLALHMWMGIAVATVSLIIFATVAARKFDSSYKIASVGLLILLFLTGHLGGSLTHGSGYLTSALNTNEEAAKSEEKIITNVQEAVVYADIIQPMLQSKCNGCHGPKRQKGKLRLDSPEWMLKGGKDGPAIDKGRAEESEMIKRILLPKEDDDHMPPRQKPQLNERQIAILHWWIESGADFTKKVKELPQDDKMKGYLLALQQSQVKKNTTALIPSEEVEKANEKYIQALREKGVIIIPVAQNSNYLSANFINWTNASDQDMNFLLLLKKQLAWLKLGDTKIGDKGLEAIAQCTNLNFLQLNGTNITDAGLPLLNSLIKLQSLNLVNTKITEAGIMKLDKLKNLQSLYLYQSKVASNSLPELKKIFPKTILDFGGYSVPTYAADTTEFELLKKNN